MNVRRRESVRGLRAQVYEAVRGKRIERKRGTDEGCQQDTTYIRAEQGTRNRTAAGGHMEVRETPGRKNQRVGRGGKMRKRDRGTPGETRGEKRTQ